MVYLEKQSLVAQRIGLKLELTYGDLEVIQCNKDSLQCRATAMLTQSMADQWQSHQASASRGCAGGQIEQSVYFIAENTQCIQVYIYFVCVFV